MLLGVGDALGRAGALLGAEACRGDEMIVVERCDGLTCGVRSSPLQNFLSRLVKVVHWSCLITEVDAWGNRNTGTQGERRENLHHSRLQTDLL